MNLYSAYFDESGTHAGSDVVVVAGYVASSSHWIDFSIEWQRALDEFGISYFHMTDFANGAKAYAAWNKEQRRDRLNRLIDIISRHVFSSVAYAIPMKSFNKIFSARSKSICGGAYGLATACCFTEMGQVASDPGVDGWIEYVFESGDKDAGTVRKIVNSHLRDPETNAMYRFHSLSYADKHHCQPLQAADMLAYEVYRHLPRQMGWRPPTTARYPLQQLGLGLRRWGYLSDDQLRQWEQIISIRARLEDAGELKPL